VTPELKNLDLAWLRCLLLAGLLLLLCPLAHRWPLLPPTRTLFFPMIERQQFNSFALFKTFSSEIGSKFSSRLVDKSLYDNSL
jgi:hypothetical protein